MLFYFSRIQIQRKCHPPRPDANFDPNKWSNKQKHVDALIQELCAVHPHIDDVMGDVDRFAPPDLHKPIPKPTRPTRPARLQAFKTKVCGEWGIQGGFETCWVFENKTVDSACAFICPMTYKRVGMIIEVEIVVFPDEDAGLPGIIYLAPPLTISDSFKFAESLFNPVMRDKHIIECSVYFCHWRGRDEWGIAHLLEGKKHFELNPIVEFVEQYEKSRKAKEMREATAALRAAAAPAPSESHGGADVTDAGDVALAQAFDEMHEEIQIAELEYKYMGDFAENADLLGPGGSADEELADQLAKQELAEAGFLQPAAISEAQKHIKAELAFPELAEAGGMPGCQDA